LSGSFWAESCAGGCLEGTEKQKRPEPKRGRLFYSLILQRFTESGRRDLNPRPPEPHLIWGRAKLQQDVAFQRGIERRRPVLRSSLLHSVARNSTQTRPLDCAASVILALPYLLARIESKRPQRRRSRGFRAGLHLPCRCLDHEFNFPLRGGIPREPGDRFSISPQNLDTVPRYRPTHPLQPIRTACRNSSVVGYHEECRLDPGAG